MEQTGLIALLNNGRVACHPLIIGELACGNLKDRNEVLSLLWNLPLISQAENEEVLQFIERRRLWGKGLGFVDMHLLVASLVSRIPLWTFDKPLRNIASELFGG
jgi:hypothetical protein